MLFAVAVFAGCEQVVTLEAPTGLTATHENGSVTLTWEDNCDSEDGYMVERNTAGGDYRILATLAEDTTTYTNTVVEAGTAYGYRVLAYAGEDQSAYSNEATVTIPGSPGDGDIGSADLLFAVPEEAELVAYQSESITADGSSADGYSLAQFVDMDTVNSHVGLDGADGRVLFTYEMLADDGYSAGGLTWDQLSSGYLVPSSDYKAYFPGDDIPGNYAVKYLASIRLYRKIDVVKANGTSVSVEVGTLTLESVTYMNTKGTETNIDDGVSLTAFITEDITTSPGDYSYKLVCADSYVSSDSSNTFDWATIQMSYWIPGSDKAVFLDADGNQIFKSIKLVQSIELLGDGTEEPADDNQTGDEPDTAALSFTVPADLSGYTSEDVDYDGTAATGYSLDQLVSMDEVNTYLGDDSGDGRSQFTYELVASDGYAASGLTWEQFQTGYLLPDQDGTAYFPAEDIPGRYNVKDLQTINLYSAN